MLSLSSNATSVSWWLLDSTAGTTVATSQPPTSTDRPTRTVPKSRMNETAARPFVPTARSNAGSRPFPP